MEIKKVSKEEMSKIIETRQPRGLFWCVSNGLWVVCDNYYGYAWVEEFKRRADMKKWLLWGEDMQKRRNYIHFKNYDEYAHIYIIQIITFTIKLLIQYDNKWYLELHTKRKMLRFHSKNKREEE